jgi:hypothetical protein
MRLGVSRDGLVICIAAGLAAATSMARADHPCDPVSGLGWRIIATHEVVDQTDGPPFQKGASGNWYVERTTTVLPYCSYISPVGIYSMRSYSLSPETTKQHLQICRADGGKSVAVEPYAGICAPK